MIRVELRKVFTRPRTWVTILLLVGIPNIAGIFLSIDGRAPRPGEGPALLSEVLSNGTLFPAASLALILPVFLPIAVSVIAGDTIAGESSFGTLRYLLARPVSRSKLLVSKLVAVMAFVVVTIVIVAAVGLVSGGILFDLEPLTTVSGSGLTYQETLMRTLITMVFVGISMLGLASIAIFASTRTDSPLAAALSALAAFVTSQILDLLDATRVIQPYLPTHYWLSFIDLFRDPILWRNVWRGFALQGVYIAVFLGAAWAHFSTKDVAN